ncbi:MAG: single-stranded DNA-binding protein [Deltaproteobacteria bacterium]|nr:single-stranded DNA-binding protein [Deltaproteobacteria bacterium]
MAEGVNRVILVGNLGKDPEVRFTQGGTAQCKFSMATTESYNNNVGERQERTEWHNIVVWGKQAETVGKFLAKGRQVYVEGRIQTRSYDDKEGKKRYITEINANRVIFLGGRGDGGGRDAGHGGQGDGQAPTGGHGSGPDFSPADDDIPF